MRPIVIAALLLAACGASPTRSDTGPPGADEARAAWDAWRVERREELVGPEGWLALVGLFWLEPGESTIGSDPSSTFVLPASAPAHVGRVRLDHAVQFIADASVTRDGVAVTDVVLTESDSPLTIGSLRMVLIARGDRLALRVRDLESAARQSFGELPVYAYDPSLRVRATVRAPEPGRMLSLVNVLGMQVDEPCIALLDLAIDGATITLAASAGGDRPEDHFFVMLRDATAAAGETYPAGRYLDVPAADTSGQTWVDFNRLHTPPCGYTSFATCPLPPDENVLTLAIRGGERYVQHE